MSELVVVDCDFCCRHKGYLTDMENDADPELMLEILTRLGQTIMRANDLEK